MVRTLARLGGALVAILVALIGLVVLLFGDRDIPAAELDARYGTPPSQFLVLEDGTRVHFRDEGPRDAPVLMLVHGANDSLFTWNGWVAALSDRFRIVRLDLQAHGLTGAVPSGDYSTEAMVDLVDRLRARLGIARLAIAGNSMGGGVSWRYALAHPDVVSALILVDAGGYPMTGPPPLVFRMQRIPLVRDLLTVVTPRAIVAASLRRFVGDPAVVTPDLVTRMHALLLRAGTREAVISRQSEPPKSAEAWRDMGRIAAPTLILWGARDPVIPVALADRFAADIPGSKLIIYPDLGHLPQVEAPERTAADVAAFLGGS